jgi:hypothetical protein
MAEWICDGVPKDGKQYHDSEAHEPHTNYAADCDLCGLPKEAMSPSTRIIGSKLPVKAISIGVGLLISVLAIALVGTSLIGDGCPQGTQKMEDECIDPYLEVHNTAVKNGDSALKIIRSYRSVSDLQQAQKYLDSAITELNNIPESALIYSQAQTKLTEYDRLAVQVGNVINNFQLCAIEPKPDDCLF